LLAPDDLLVRVLPSLGGLGRGLDAPAVDGPGRRVLVAPVLAAPPAVERLVDRGEGAVVAPPLEVGVDRLVVGEVTREVAPAAGVLGLVEDAVEDAAAVDARATTSRARRRKQRGVDLPLGVGEIGGVRLVGHGDAVRETGSTLHHAPFVVRLSYASSSVSLSCAP